MLRIFCLISFTSVCVVTHISTLVSVRPAGSFVLVSSTTPQNSFSFTVANTIFHVAKFLSDSDIMKLLYPQSQFVLLCKRVTVIGFSCHDIFGGFI